MWVKTLDGLSVINVFGFHISKGNKKILFGSVENTDVGFPLGEFNNEDDCQIVFDKICEEILIGSNYFDVKSYCHLINSSIYF